MTANAEPGPGTDADTGSMIERARRYLDGHAGERVTLARLAAAVGVSPSHLQRRFKRATGLSPLDYQREHRLHRAKALLGAGHGVTRAVFEAGYGSLSRFYERGTERLGMRAKDYRAGGKGLAIEYCIFPTRIGTVLAAATERGLCAIRIGDDGPALARTLEQEFSAASLRRSDASLAGVRRAVLAFLDGDDSLTRLPLDLRGTVFQKRVWQALRDIPAGSTRTYGEIAAQIGAPAAVRAVGSACGANPVALAIPCHRALRADGGLGGYAWGVARKEQLLTIETGARVGPARGRRTRRVE
jgi:AraC family transcriptional regulator of adaptative response/methylated-DNA-[protein]-cysteine methyltransferase